MRSILLWNIRRFAMLTSIVCLWVCNAHGFRVPSPLPLEELAAEADIIFKGTVISNTPVPDGTHEAHSGAIPYETTFSVVSVIQGNLAKPIVCFRHFDQNPEIWKILDMMPQYRFQSERSYVVFAKGTEEADVLRPTQKGSWDQDGFLCADNAPVTIYNLNELFWNELLLLLKSPDTNDATYAIRRLNLMSGGSEPFNSTQDFDRDKVLAAVRDCLTNPAPEIAQAAIRMIGSLNPYLSEESSDHWLVTIGNGEFPGLGKLDPNMRNKGGTLYWQDLQDIGSSTLPAETRAMAIRALGLVCEPALRKSIGHWLSDTEPAVRAAAAVLLADFPELATSQQISTLAGDSEPVVRIGVVRAIGFSQKVDSVDVLAMLLTDKDPEVRRTASMSLLSFSLKEASVARIFEDQLDNLEFEPLFLNALARENPSRYLDTLAQVIEEKSRPKNWHGGQFPDITAWKILFKYLQSQTPETLRSGDMDRYLDALEKVRQSSSTELRDIYKFYLFNQMPKRAKAYKEMITRTCRFNMDHYFRQVEQNPLLYPPAP